MAFKLKEIVKEAIKSDSDLFSIVSKELDIKPYSLPGALATNNNRLTQYHVIKKIAEYMKCEPNELMEEHDDSNAKTKVKKEIESE
jgi:hypothetical protein